jgi:hypothetical protein
MKQLIDAIVRDVTRQFRTFGAGQTSEYNPLVNALKDHEPMFAAGVDVREVVEFVIEAVKKAK